MPNRLTSKVAVVTGASSGIGRAIALAYHREGAFIVCSDIREGSRNEHSGEIDVSTHEVILKDEGKAIFVKADTSKAEEVETLIKRAVEEFGRVDIMVNNAGIAIEAYNPQPIWEYSEDSWDRTLAVNAKGVYLGCKYASAQMIKQEPHGNGDRGWIVNLASVLGLGGTPKSTGYCASKHAVMGMTKAIAWDCAPYRIHCNAICPGYVGTAMTASVLADLEFRTKLEKMHPFRGLGEPEDIARTAVFLASEDCSWITGVGLPVDGGYTAI